MIRKLNSLFLLIMVALLSACAPQPQQKIGPYFQPDQKPIPNGYSELYIYQHHDAMNMGAHTISIDLLPVASLQDSTYTKILVKPGSHFIGVSDLAKEESTFKITESGKKYYLHFGIYSKLEPSIFAKNGPQRVYQGYVLKLEDEKQAKGQLAFCHWVNPLQQNI